VRRGEPVVLVAALALVILSVPSPAAVIHVPDEQPTIQQGINAATAGDTVMVAPGTYTGPLNRTLDLGGTNMVVMSAAGAESTTIDCEDLGVCFHIVTGENPTSVISGFTITRGSGSNGAGMIVEHASPVIEDCIFTKNIASSNGAGIYYAFTSVAGAIRNCVFFDNTAEYRGGGLFCDFSTVAVTGCTFYENSVTATTGHPSFGGGGLAGNTATVTATSCTFARNTANTGAGGIQGYNSTIEVERSIVAFSQEGSGIVGGAVTHCVVFGNAGGDSLSGSYHDNLFVDPRFCGMAADDYTLCSNSACLSGSPENPWGELIGAYEQDCGDCDSTVESTSWGVIKAMYR